MKTGKGGWLEEVMDWDCTLSYRAALMGHATVKDSRPVVLFRERRLGAGLLPPNPRRIAAWLREQAGIAASGRDKSREDPGEALGLRQLVKEMREPRVKAHPEKVPDPDFPKTPLSLSVRVRWAIRPGHLRSEDFEISALPTGSIGELFWVGAYLQDEFGWDPAFARGWVLVDGAIPWTHALGRDPHRWHEPVTPNLSRHRIMIDAALELPIRRIVGHVSETIEDRVGAYPPLARPIDSAILEATLFTALRNDGRAWEDVLEEWNESVSAASWRYEAGREGTRRFAKDVRRTYKKLIGEALEWQRGPGKPRED